MREHLAQQFVDLCHVGLTAQGIAKLALDHPHGGLNEGAAVVVGQERLAVQHEEVIEAVPYILGAVHAGRIGAEGDVGHGVQIVHQL